MHELKGEHYATRPLVHYPSACTLKHALPTKRVLHNLFLVAEITHGEAIFHATLHDGVDLVSRSAILTRVSI